MTVRAKMRCDAIQTPEYGAGRVYFNCVYDPGSVPEDQAFTKFTPSGTATFLIDNPPALAQFVVGESYYVDFTPVAPVAATVPAEETPA